jgi:toxin ParE1/3/4
VARELRWSPEALDDIQAIASHIGRHSHWYASTVTKRFFRVAENLAYFAESGRIVPEFDEADVREGFIYSYRMIYQILDDHVMMLTIIHMKQLLTPESVPIRRETKK